MTKDERIQYCLLRAQGAAIVGWTEERDKWLAKAKEEEATND